MLLRYNIKDIKRERRLLKIKSYDTVISNDSKYASIKFTTSTPHRLMVGDVVLFVNKTVSGTTFNQVKRLLNESNPIVYLTKDDGDYAAGAYSIVNNIIVKLTDNQIDEHFYRNTSVNERYKVTGEDFTDTTFTINIELFKPIRIVSYIDGNEITVNEMERELPFPVTRNEEFKLRRKIWQYVKTDIDNIDDYRFMEVSVLPVEYNGYDYIKCGTFKYIWSYIYDDDIDCKHISRRYFESPIGILAINEDYEIEDTRFVANGSFKNSYNVYEYIETINLHIPLSNQNISELYNEENAQVLLNERKQSLIPDIVDYEKRCFSPYDDATAIERISFHLYFRDRSNSDNWTTNDIMGWNQYKIENGSFVLSDKTSDGDLIGCLNFTDDDIYYRKQKVSKSFLRLSFYDSTDPMRQMLLFYSTIFLDSGDLYGKYIKHIDKKYVAPGITQNLVEDNTLGEDNLTVSFHVYDRYNREHSSEGFYLYLFPDGLDKGNTRRIYMKAEFNHAGYGITVPLMFPNNTITSFDFKHPDFPTSLIDGEDGSLKDYYRQVYIPIDIWYDDVKNEYKYKVVAPIDKKNNNWIIHLYEPKLNPIE